MSRMEDHILKGVPAMATVFTGFIASINPNIVSPWVSIVVGCLAGIYYLKMIFKREKK